MKRIRRFIKVVLSYFLFYSGALAVVRWVNRNRRPDDFHILMYHHVTPNGEEGVPLSVFKKQINWVGRHYPVVSLSRYLRDRKGGKTVPNGALAVTFDDGHLDFLTTAYPILEEKKIPVTLFAVVDCLDRKPLWTEVMKTWFQKTNQKRLALTLKGEALSFSLETEKEKRAARDILKERLKQARDDQRRASLKEIRKSLIGGLPEAEEKTSMLTWEELTRLTQEGVEIGAHSLDHPILAQMRLSEARHQIVESKRRLEEKLKKPVSVFCYPNGERQDFNDEIEKMVEKAGFLGACTIIEGRNGPTADPYCLKRVPTWERSLPVFACQLEGCFDRFSKPQRSLREEVETFYAKTKEDLTKTLVIVMGQSRTGVSTNQLLGRRGIAVVKVAKNPKALGAYSRYGTFEQVEPGDTASLLSLMKRAKERTGVRPVLIPTSDEMVEWLSDDRATLQKEGSFLLPEKKVIDSLLNKALFAREASRLGVSVPKIMHIERAEGPVDILHERLFPYVLKPSNGHPLGFGEEKALWIETEKELKTVSDRLFQEGVSFLIQEAIPGEDSCHWSCAVYLDADGEPLACFTARKIRQYPPVVGMASLCESQWNEQVASEAITLLQKLGYVGVAEVEFKEDPRDGVLKVIEINPRLWAQHPLAARCGLDFAFLLYQGSLGVSPEKLGRQRDGIRWVAFDLDLLTVRQLFREGKMDVSRWIGAYRTPIEPDLFHMSDPGPAICQTAKLTKSFLFKKRRAF